MARGNNGGLIFIDQDDYALFCRLVEAACQKFGFLALAYCLMPNHLHLMLQLGLVSLSEVMQWILGIYARELNEKNGRVGHVFQGRFLCKVVSGSVSALRVSRYIHRNPLEAGLETELGEWRWSSLAAYDGERTDISVGVDMLLNALGGAERGAYRRFVAAAREPHMAGEWYREDAAFVSPELPRSDRSEVGVIASKIISVACRKCGIGPEELLGIRRPRSVSKARRLAAHGLRQELNLSLEEIGALIGVKSSGSVAYLLEGASLFGS